MRRLIPTLAPLCLMAACGGSHAPAKSAPSGDGASAQNSDAESASAAKDTAADESPPATIPMKCAKTDPCVPPKDFVDRLCNGSFPGATLYLFQKSAPFTHAFLTRRTEAWNASGGLSGGGYLEFDEEVVLLRSRKANLGGMQVSGAGGGYDALRWDGSCVTLAAEEVTQNRPPAPKAAKVVFRFLDRPIRDALREDETVDQAYLARRKECKGATTGEVSLKCVKNDAKLSDSIVEYVRGGGKIPMPENLP